MEFKPFYIETKGLSGEQIAAVFDKAVQQGASVYDGVDGINDDHFTPYDPVGFRFFGVDGDGDTYFNNRREDFGPDAVRLTIDQVDEHLGLSGIPTETPEEKEALDAIKPATHSVGDQVYINKKGYDISEHSKSFVGIPVRVACHFKTQPDDTYDSVDMVAVSKHSGDSCCFRADMVETPEQRNERERLEAAYDLFCCFKRECGVVRFADFDKWKRTQPIDSWLEIVDKTGYRKDNKND